ncbi:TetR/AcrR family transcriptional regulator [Arthrobacter sp. NPDC056493]|uniref:TetR/AcrR family transcriptional regulator n=1 Tax=Arthrobacter sp. NPDC056493 TaxID=3345839 RepID=UPI00366D4A7B
MNGTDAVDGGTAEATASGHQRRRARTERVVQDATRELLAESGFGSLTIERVAERSGVAKSTIYRRYRSRNDLALAVLLDMLGDVSTLPYAKDTRQELTRLVDRTVDLMSNSLLGRIMQGLVSEVAADVELAKTYRETVVAKRVREVTALVERGVERGELREGLDPELVTDVLLGPIYYRLFLSGEPLDERFGGQLVAALYPAFAKDHPG